MIGAPARAAARASRARWTVALAVFAIATALLAYGLASARSASRATAPPRAPAIRLPRGFASAARYAHLVREYRFDGDRLPGDWSEGTWNYGFAATQFQPSQVHASGSAAALEATAGVASQGLPYKSGLISTEGAYTLTHGMVDFRVSMPPGQGLWGGVWMDNAAGVEIDDAEVLLGNPHTVYGSLHTHTWSEIQPGAVRRSLARGYHDFQVIWQPGLITWAVDGRAYAQYSRARARAAGRPWPYDQSGGVYLIADLAVAGQTEWGGPPTARTPLPARMRIKSVTVWQ
ncbi:MAG TPA: glycoside hydrolase family 16 protein [Solirubrobacteraceae bacterium]|jgi:beta-glucanase (GH16 family)